MILVADSGSTNTDWAIIEGDKITSIFTTKGFSPYFTKSEEIPIELKKKIPRHIQLENISEVYFYGSGCSSPQMNSIINEGLKRFFQFSSIKIDHDLLAAARALFFNESGIVLVLGTGSNTCIYDGTTIIKNVPSLGYVLGDEGGGDYLGKLFITNLLYNNIPKEIYKDFTLKYNLTQSDILYKIYKGPNPNRFLASFGDFVLKHSQDSTIDKIIKKSFTDLFLKHITRYANYQDYKIRVSGSVGFYFQEQLKEVAKDFNTHIDLIERNPIIRLAQYHINNH
ncbi:MAG TPA: ATPase [Bacteroidales bacterium]|nr:ATPase [Bacteroidales bacterium]